MNFFHRKSLRLYQMYFTQRDTKSQLHCGPFYSPGSHLKCLGGYGKGTFGEMCGGWCVIGTKGENDFQLIGPKSFAHTPLLLELLSDHWHNSLIYVFCTLLWMSGSFQLARVEMRLHPIAIHFSACTVCLLPGKLCTWEDISWTWKSVTLRHFCMVLGKIPTSVCHMKEQMVSHSEECLLFHWHTNPLFSSFASHEIYTISQWIQSTAAECASLEKAAVVPILPWWRFVWKT